MAQRKEYQKKICLLGDGAVGKTSLIRKYVMNVFDDKYIATVGTKVSRKEMVIVHPKTEMEVDLTLMIWDVVGQKQYQKLRMMYYQGANGAIVVCDISRKDTLEGLHDWASSIRQGLGDIPLVFLVNKIDLIGQRQMSDDQIKEMADRYSSEFMFTSALSGQNVENAFERIGELMLEPV